LSFYFVFSLIQTSFFTWKTLPQWQNVWQQTWVSLREQWPAEAQAQLDNGTVTLQGSDTVDIAFPEEIAKKYTLPQYFVVIDPQLDLQNQDVLKDTPALLLVTQHDLSVKSTAGTFESLALSDVFPQENFTIDSQVLQNSSATVQANIQNTTFSLLPLVFGWFWLGRLISHLVILVLVTWLVQPLLWLFGWFMKYRHAYRLGLFLLPIAEEISWLLARLYPSQHWASFWLVWFLAFLAVGWSNRRMIVVRTK